MKRSLTALLVCILCLLTWQACAAGVTKLTLSAETMTLQAGSTALPLVVTVSPDDADHTVNWTTSDSNVAMVDAHGAVTAVAAGKVNIIATSVENSKRTATCRVTVMEPVTALALSAEQASVNVGGRMQLNVEQQPANCTKRSVVWTSSDEKVAKVSANGSVTAKKAGQTTITAAVTLSDGRKISAECVLTVVQPVTRMIIEKKSLTMVKGTTQSAPKLTIEPADASVKAVHWSSSDTDVVTINAFGKLHAHAVGTAVITAESLEKTQTPRKVSFQVTVEQPITTLKVPQTLRVMRKKSASLTAEILPQDASNKSVVWSSSNTDVATVNSKGSVYGVAPGKAIITCTAVDGHGASAACEVQVYVPVSGLSSSNGNTVVMTEGTTKTVNYAITPKSATNKTLQWVSSDPRIATVSNATITGLVPGNCTVTAATTDGSERSISFRVTVEPKEPVSVLSVKRRARYGGDKNSLFVTPLNNCAYRTIATFRFELVLADANGDTLKRFQCEWDKNFPIIKPGEQGDSGYWHWYALGGVMDAAKLGITITAVSYTDGTRQTIPENNRVTKWFDTFD